MRQITIMAMIDVANALADRSLAGNLYFLDNHRTGGSIHEGTEVLRTQVRKGDELVWMVHSLQAETFVEMSGITLSAEPGAIELSKQYFRDTDIVIWVGKVKKHLEQAIPYKVDFDIGSSPVTMTTPRCPSLFSRHLLGQGADEAPTPDEKPESTEPDQTPPSTQAAKVPKKPAAGRSRKRKAP